MTGKLIGQICQCFSSDKFSLPRAFIKLIFFGVLTLFFNACATQSDFLKQQPAFKKTLEERPNENTRNRRLNKISQNEKPKKSYKESDVEIQEARTSLKKNNSPNQINQHNKDPSVNKKKPELEDLVGKAAAKIIDLTNIRMRLIGMDGEKIVDILGTPAFKRSEPPARIWQYRTVVCVVNIFFYKNKEKLLVEYVEPRRRMGKDTDEEGCFKSILKMKPGYIKVS